MGVIVENFKNGEENYLCAVNMGCIVLADLYLLYFVKMADEKNYYEKQLIASARAGALSRHSRGRQSG